MTMLVLYRHSEVLQDTYISRNVHLAYFICVEVVTIEKKPTILKKKDNPQNQKKAESHHYQETH